MKYNILLILILSLGCTSKKEQSKLNSLLEYEGNYEYISENTLDIVLSEIDTTLYAVIDDAKYPLKYINKDTFTNIQNTPVIFGRNESGSISHYKVNNQNFKIITTDFERMEMSPRKELLNDPDKYGYNQPKQRDDGLDVGSLSSAFNNPEPILQMVKNTISGKYPEVHSILIFKNNKLVLEEYFYGYQADQPHQLRSATKPFIGGILGIAIDKGFIKSEKESLLKYFDTQYQNIANIDSRKKQLTIENFLAYKHGMDCENDNPESKGNEQSMMESEDWVKHTLDLPMVTDPGKTSSYCTGCALTMGSLIEVATDQKIEDFAKKHLFEPMGIKNYDWTFEPNPSSQSTFSQMYLTPRDLIKLAKMYQRNGNWNNKSFQKTGFEKLLIWTKVTMAIYGSINILLLTGKNTILIYQRAMEDKKLIFGQSSI